MKLAVSPTQLSYAELGKTLGLSASQAFSAAQRATSAGLLVGTPKRANTEAVLEFLVHGAKYAFPAVRGPAKRGMATAHSAEPLRSEIRGDDSPLVWGDAAGDMRGETLRPIYNSVPFAARQDVKLYQALVLVDAIRAGRARERELAVRLLGEMLRDGTQDGPKP